MTSPLYANPSDPTVAGILRAVGYSGGKPVRISTDDTVTLSGTYWDGGSRDTYHAVDLATLRTVDLPKFAPPQFGGPRESPTVTIPAGVAIVRCSVFRGKTMGPHVIVRPDNLNPAMLPAPCDLTDAEAMVLGYTKGRKASYNGRNRLQMAYDDRCFAARSHNAPRPTLEDHTAAWDTARAALIARGLLNKAGAITVAGRNAYEAATNKPRAL